MTLSGVPNINHLWAGLLIEELVRGGVAFFVLASGSRSTPLATAVARHPTARHVVHVDERGAAFAALGYGRATGRPAGWITTSGTAVANGLPAVVEASESRVPLLLLTADRPPERRATGANQTVDQVKIFGGFVRWQFDLPAPSVEVPPQMVLTTAAQAVWRARRAPAGPVHLNCMFRKPLAPDPDGSDLTGYAAPLRAWAEAEAPYTTYAAAPAAPPEEVVDAVWNALRGAERGLVVAGRLDTRREAEAVRRLAEKLRWPLLPDVASQLRLGAGAEAAYFDGVLTSAPFQAAHAPEAVLHLGGRSLSKRLREFIDAHPPAVYAVAVDAPDRLDPDHRVTHRAEAGVEAFCAALAERATASAKGKAWQERWHGASARAGAVLDAFDADAEALSEPLVARLVARHLPAGHGLFLASSMPVRDVNRFAAPDGAAPVRVAANRGASGIDGTVASAAGFALGLKAPVTLVIGDLALLHDLNGLALLHAAPVVAIVINNDGGGIFSFLPIAKHADVFEPFFATPHGRSFEHAAALFGLPYHRPDSKTAFVEAYRAACASGRSALIEVRTDRGENLHLHQRLEVRIAEAVAQGLEGAP